jgi:hypothetical protein
MRLSPFGSHPCPAAFAIIDAMDGRRVRRGRCARNQVFAGCSRAFPVWSLV